MAHNDTDTNGSDGEVHADLDDGVWEHANYVLEDTA